MPPFCYAGEDTKEYPSLDAVENLHPVDGYFLQCVRHGQLAIVEEIAVRGPKPQTRKGLGFRV